MKVLFLKPWIPLLFLSLLGTGITKTMGQHQPLDIVTVDIVTYNLYQRLQWDSLESYGNQALAAGVDFYYLRIRMGVAAYEQKNYRTAIMHFEKALTQSSPDDFLKESLYISYLMSGRQMDGQRMAHTLGPDARDRYGIRKKPLVSYLSLDGGLSYSNSKDKEAGIDLNGPANIYGESDMFIQSQYFQVGMTHLVGHRTRVYHGFSLLDVDMEKHIQYRHLPDSATRDTIHPYTTRQLQYYLNATFSLGKGWNVSPAINLLRATGNSMGFVFSWDTTRYWANPGWDTLQSVLVNYRYDFPAIHKDYPGYVLSVMLSKDLRDINARLTAGYASLNDKQQYQLGGALTWYTFGNLNLYISPSVILFTEKGSSVRGKKQGTSTSRLMSGISTGLKLTGWAWMEAGINIGEYTNSTDQNANLVYNVPDRMFNRTSISFLFPIHKNYLLTLHYRHIEREITYLYYQNNEQYHTSSFRYQTQSITGGLQWKL